ncbi:MAG: hypothetical protein K2G91_04155, partial [Prevotella sp.]|nr:hypothetical protein [Prevotella sp.]
RLTNYSDWAKHLTLAGIGSDSDADATSYCLIKIACTLCTQFFSFFATVKPIFLCRHTTWN